MSGDSNRLLESSLNEHHARTRYVERTGSLTWKISGFTTRCPCLPGQFLKSPTFVIHGIEREWWLDLYPQRRHESEDFVALYLNSDSEEPIFITYQFSLIDVSGERLKTRNLSRVHTVGYGFWDIISREELTERKNQFLPGDELTVFCSVTKMVEITGMDRSRQHSCLGRQESSLNLDLEKLLFDDKNTDIGLKVGSDQLRAHKMLLACRSPVFASMFEHDMLENETNEVVIADIEFDVLKELVRFMYTDDISLNDVGFTVKLLVAADKYNVSALKAICAEHLCAIVSKANVFKVLRVADACNDEELSRRCMSVIETEMASLSSLPGWMSKWKECPEVLKVVEKLLDVK